MHSSNHLENYRKCILQAQDATPLQSDMFWTGIHRLMTYSKEQGPWEANRFSASQEITRILWNPKVHYRIHNCPTPIRILNQLVSVHALTSWGSVLILSSHLRLGLPHQTLYTPLLSPIRATCRAHSILDFITLTVAGEEYRSVSSSLCSFLHYPVTSSLLGPNILLSILFSNTLSLCSSMWATKFHT
jgi:hypothetical protein